MSIAPGRTLASAGTAGAGAAAGTASYLIVGGLPGVLYAAGISLAALFGAVAIGTARGPGRAPELAATPWPLPWRRPLRPAAEPELELEPAVIGSELEEHRSALVNLSAQLTRESEAARRDVQRLELRIRELESERNGLIELVAQERAWFEQTLNALGDGIGRHGNELAALEQIETLIAG